MENKPEILNKYTNMEQVLWKAGCATVKNDACQLSLDEEAEKEDWKEHYERLLNVDFPWNPDGMSEEIQVGDQASQSPPR